jgi:hypothetical protein
VGQKTKVIYDEQTVEIFIGFQRIAIHPRSHRRNGYSTLPEHVPEKHQKYTETLGWDADYFLSLAQKIGLNSVDVFTRVLAAKEFVEQTYKGCMGLKKLSEQYGTIRFEAACRRAQNASRVNYGMIRNILENNLDKQVESELQIYKLPNHGNIRGPENYN